MNSREQLIYMLIEDRYNWILGGYENSLSDGYIETLPSRELIEQEIYEEVIQSKQLSVSFGFISIEKDIRFLGKDKIKQLIHQFVEKQGEIK
jgi:hypothetical protein